MSDEGADDSQKTEDPTQRRLDEAHRKGQVSVSRELNNWLMLTGSTILVGTSASSFMASLREHLQVYIEHAGEMRVGEGGLTVILGASFKYVLGLLMMPFLVLMAIAFLGPFLQVGPVFAPDVLKFDLSKLSPLAGWKRLFSMRSIVEFVKGLLKICVVGGVGTMLIAPFFTGIDHFVGMPIPMLLNEINSLFMRMMMGILAVLMIIAIVDVVYQRLEFYKKMRMSKQEIKEEYKQSEGDPHIKAKLRQLRTEKARKRMMQSVPRADVVITNPTHYAIALEYKPASMNAPVCLAKGTDDLALRIRAEAEKHKIAIFENPPLARALYATVDIDEVVPPEHYKAVAEVISFVFRKAGKLGR